MRKEIDKHEKELMHKKMSKHERAFLKSQRGNNYKKIMSFKGGKSREKQHWNYLVSRGMMDKYDRERD